MAKAGRQSFKYSSKVAGAAGISFLTGISTLFPNYIGLQLINPQDLLTVEGLTFHFRASGMTPTNPTINQIAVVDQIASPTWNKSIAVSITGSGGVIDFTKSLSGLINKTGNNIVILNFSTSVSGTLEIWKQDMLYTVIGIR